MELICSQTRIIESDSDDDGNSNSESNMLPINQKSINATPKTIKNYQILPYLPKRTLCCPKHPNSS